MNEVLMLMFTALGAVAAAGSAIIAVVQARGARESKQDAADARDEARQARDESARLAGEADAAFVRQAEAQEEANRLKVAEVEPHDWEFSHVGAQHYRGTNTSKRVLFVQTYEVQPDEAAALLTVQTRHEDGRYKFGDSFDFFVLRVMGPSPERLTLHHRREDDPEDGIRKIHVGV